MRVLPFLLLVCALPVRPARAQVAAKQAPSTPIRYSRDVPPSVLKLMPRGAKSLFWGKFSPKKGSALIAIHLFNRTPKESGYNVIHAFQVDLFRLQKRRWQKISRVPFQYPAAFGGANKAVDAQFFWVDKQEKIPLLKFRVFDPNGFRGPIGDEVSVAFPSGFSKSATTQSWAWGNWSDSDSLGQTLDWSQRDENGFLKVTVELGTTNPDPTQRMQRSIWRWNGQKWVVK